MLVWLQTADYIGLASPVQEAQRATTPRDRTGIVRFTLGEQIEVVALHFAHHRRRIFSALAAATHPGLHRYPLAPS